MLAIFYKKEFKYGNCMILFRNFVNLLTSYLFRYISHEMDLSRNSAINPMFQSDSSRPGNGKPGTVPNPLEALQKIFKKRITPFVSKKLKIKGWIPLPHRNENILLKVLFEYNRTSPGFVLVLKCVFDHLKVFGRGKGVLARELWRLILSMKHLKNSSEDKKRFFQVLERHFDPIDTVSNYLLRVGKMENQIFMGKAKLCLNMDLSFEEFVMTLSLFYFFSENERFSNLVSNLKTMTPLFYELHDNLLVTKFYFLI